MGKHFKIKKTTQSEYINMKKKKKLNCYNPNITVHYSKNLEEDNCTNDYKEHCENWLHYSKEKFVEQ